MYAALPFFVLSGISLILWIHPGGRVLLTVEEMGMVMSVEGFVLFACMWLTVAASIVRLPGRVDAPWQMLFVSLVAAVMLGSVAGMIGGRSAFVSFVLVAILHLVGVFRMSHEDLKIEFAATMVTLFPFVGLGVLAVKAPFLPDFGNKYPPVFDAFAFRIGGHQMLAWACAHFALLGFVHLWKRRMFAHMLKQDL